MIDRFRVIVDAAYQREPAELLYTVAKHHAAFEFVCAYNATYNLLTKILYRECMPATIAGGKIVHAFRDDHAFNYAAALLAQSMTLLPGDMVDALNLFMLDPEPPIFTSFVRLAGYHLRTTVGADMVAWNAAQAAYASDSADPIWYSANSMQQVDIYMRSMRGDDQPIG